MSATTVCHQMTLEKIKRALGGALGPANPRPPKIVTARLPFLERRPVTSSHQGPWPLPAG